MALDKEGVVPMPNVRQRIDEVLRNLENSSPSSISSSNTSFSSRNDLSLYRDLLTIRERCDSLVSQFESMNNDGHNYSPTIDWTTRQAITELAYAVQDIASTHEEEGSGTTSGQKTQRQAV